MEPGEATTGVVSSGETYHYKTHRLPILRHKTPERAMDIRVHISGAGTEGGGRLAGADNTIRPPPLQPFYNSGTTGPIGTNETPFESGGTILSAVSKLVTPGDLGDLKRSTRH